MFLKLKKSLKKLDLKSGRVWVLYWFRVFMRFLGFLWLFIVLSRCLESFIGFLDKKWVENEIVLNENIFFCVNIKKKSPYIFFLILLLFKTQ